MDETRTSLAKGAGYVVVLVSVAALIFTCVHGAKTQPVRRVAPAAAQVSGASSQFASKWTDVYAKLPLAFEQNEGQTDSRVRFVSYGSGYQLFLTPQEAVLALHAKKMTSGQPANRAANSRMLRAESIPGKTSILQVKFEGANAAAKIEGLDHLPRVANYFIGDNPKDWRTGVPSYARVAYRDIYPGVDLVFYGNQRRLEYDYVVAPGADPKVIALSVKGAAKLRIDSRGNLMASMPGGDVELEKPVVYQEIEGARKEIAANYVLVGDDRVTLSVAGYDRSKSLIVDPVLDYSTYLGGSATGDAAFGIAVDGSGNAYLTGQTYNIAFPLSAGTKGYNTNSPDPGVALNGAVFVSELNPTGTTELYFTYLGGTGAGEGGEVGNGIAVDASGNVYVVGQSFSTNYPTTATNAIDAGPLASVGPFGNAFISELNPAVTGASSLVYSSYIGDGAAGDFANAVAAGCSPKSGATDYACNSNNTASIQANSLAYITGVTYTGPANFPIQGGFQTTLPSANGVAFLTVINTTAATPAAALVYSTYLGGDGAYCCGVSSYLPFFGDAGAGVAADSAGNAYIVGTTGSDNFPTTGDAFQASPKNTNASAFVTEISTITANNGAASLVYSSYLGGATGAGGGTPAADGLAVALGPSNIVYATGTTSLSDFHVTANSYPSSATAAGVAFVTLMNTSSGAVPYSTLFGGSNGDEGLGIQSDAEGNAYIAGQTGSANFPVTSGAYQTALGTGAALNAFLSEINPGGGGCSGAACLLYSTYLGGTGTDKANGLALLNGATATSPSNAYLGGQTTSSNFPTTMGAFQTTFVAGQDAFAAELTVQPTLSVSPSTIPFGSQTVLTTTTPPVDVTLTNNTSSAIAFTTSFSGANPADFATSGGTCVGSVPASSSCTVGVTFTPSNPPSAESATLSINFGAASNPAAQVALTGTGTAAPSFTISSLPAFPGQLVTTTSSGETLTITNNGGAALPISSVTITGADAADFAASPGGANACANNSVPANSSCTYSVTFTPAAGTAGTLTATLTVTSGANSQHDALSGTAWDFSLTAPPSTTATRGTPDTFMVTVNSLGGFTGNVTVACSASINSGGCAVTSPSNGIVAAGGPPATVTVTTRAFVPPPAGRHIPPISPRQMLLVLLALTLLFILPAVRRAPARLGLAGVALFFVFLAGCAGTPGTREGNYTLTITGSSGSVTHQTTVNLTVD